MTTTLHNRTLASIIAEFYTEGETKWVVFCDEGSGSSFRGDGRVINYDPETMGHLIMTDIPDDNDRISADGFESLTQSEWQEGEGSYRWRVRF